MFKKFSSKILLQIFLPCDKNIFIYHSYVLQPGFECRRVLKAHWFLLALKSHTSTTVSLTHSINLVQRTLVCLWVCMWNNTLCFEGTEKIISRTFKNKTAKNQEHYWINNQLHFLAQYQMKEKVFDTQAASIYATDISVKNINLLDVYIIYFLYHVGNLSMAENRIVLLLKVQK